MAAPTADGNGETNADGEKPIGADVAALEAQVAVMVEEVGDAEPAVRRVLSDFPPFVVPQWLTTHRELSTSGRLRVVFDLLLAELAPKAST